MSVDGEPLHISGGMAGAAALPTIVLHLPCPPSANSIWRKVPGMKRPQLSAEYRAWIETAGWTARTQLVGIPTIVGAFNAAVTVPAKSRRDRDNWTKPIFDLCQRVGAVRNDSGLRSYTVSADNRSDCMVALFDLGGPPVAAGRVAKATGGNRKQKPSRAKIDAYRRAGVRV